MNENDILSEDALEKLTGWKQSKKQIEQLRKQGIPFFINGKNKPVVLATALEVSQQTPSKKQTQTKWSPTVLN